MAKDVTRVSKSAVASGKQDGDGNEVRNLILRGIPRSEAVELFPSLEFVRLTLHQVLHEAGETIKSAYFLNNGLGSVLTVQPDGKSVEVGLIGKEGFIGLPVIFGFKTSGLRVVTQAEGTGFRIDVGTLKKHLKQCPNLEGNCSVMPCSWPCNPPRSRPATGCTMWSSAWRDG